MADRSSGGDTLDGGPTAGEGVFITFEGPEGAGKTVQLERLAGRIAALGPRVVRTREPGGTRPGERIRAVLLEADPDGVEVRAQTEALLFCAARAEVVSRVIRPALEAGCVVLCDRYSDSTFAYQGFGRGLDLDELRRLDGFATDGLHPDRTLLLDVPVQVGLARRAAGSEPLTRLDSAGLEFHQRVRAGFHELAEAEPERWRVIDADRAIEAVENDIWRAVGDVLAGGGRARAPSGRVGNPPLPGGGG